MSNRVEGTHLLPAVVLASVCGHVADTATYQLTAEMLAKAGLLAPAEAATHVGHPNLWSWRALLAASRPSSRFLAFFVRNIGDDPVDRFDCRFRSILGRQR
jgi:hypothetical protein